MDNSDDSKCSALPQRVIISFLGFLSIVVSFLMRGCLSIAITEMVVPMNSTASSNESINTAPMESSSMDGTRYNWSQEQQGYILSSFFYGYLITHIPGALLAQKFGGKWTLGLGVLGTTICNAATPIGVWYGGYVALIILRVMMGLFNGSMYPALSVLLACWVPEKERGKLAAFVLGGAQIGFLISFYVSGLILSHFPWPVVFYFWSGVAAIWFILFALICYNDPESHPFISKKELAYLELEIGQLKRHNNLPSTPWKEIFTSVPILVLIIAQVINDYVFYVLASDLPKYMKEVLKFSVADIGFYSSMPYLLMWIVSLVAGFISDHLISGGYVTVTQARKFFGALSSVFPSACTLAASYAEYNKTYVVLWLTLCFGFQGCYYAGLRVNILDLSPNYSGPIMAVINGIASFSGMAAPTFVGMMIPDSTLEQWRLVFIVSFGISMVRTIIYTVWASAEIQPWNDRNKSPESKNLTGNTDDCMIKEILE
ncbi:sialin-like [Sitodiplosis mosellana]|uniref:sialin-like n=1 Tax=Sitodiplosis mosellana TaxID=263140 RepID=UPI002444435D|nr:sialin-like [Sitodiplosis mosellana]